MNWVMLMLFCKRDECQKLVIFVMSDVHFKKVLAWLMREGCWFARLLFYSNPTAEASLKVIDLDDNFLQAAKNQLFCQRNKKTRGLEKHTKEDHVLTTNSRIFTLFVLLCGLLEWCPAGPKGIFLHSLIANHVNCSVIVVHFFLPWVEMTVFCAAVYSMHF